MKISSLDIIEFLGLDKDLSVQEVDNLLDLLSREIWYRILNEELLKLLGEEEFKKLKKKVQSNDVSTVLNTVKSDYKNVNIDKIFEHVAGQVKKEYVLDYLKNKLKSLKSEESRKVIESKLKQVESLET